MPPVRCTSYSCCIGPNNSLSSLLWSLTGGIGAPTGQANDTTNDTGNDTTSELENLLRGRRIIISRGCCFLVSLHNYHHQKLCLSCESDKQGRAMSLWMSVTMPADALLIWPVGSPQCAVQPKLYLPTYYSLFFSSTLTQRLFSRWSQALLRFCLRNTRNVVRAGSHQARL